MAIFLQNPNASSEATSLGGGDPRTKLRNLTTQQAAERVVTGFPPNINRLVNLWVHIRGESGMDTSHTAIFERAKEVFELWQTYGLVPNEQISSKMDSIENQIQSNETVECSFNITEKLVRTLLNYLVNQNYPNTNVNILFRSDSLHVHGCNTIQNVCREYIFDTDILGRGSFGEVIGGECINHTITSTPNIKHVAIKEVDIYNLTSHMNDKKEIKDLENKTYREIVNGKYISHTNIVQFVDYLSLTPDNGRPSSHDKMDEVSRSYTGAKIYLIMERCPGRELYHYLESNTISTLQLLKSLSQICRAVLYLHECKIIHRDIKPENIGYYCDPNDINNVDKVICKLFDFGLSKKIGDSPSQMGFTRQVGTEEYRAPEIDDKNIELHDYKVDVYSLGIVIAYCFAREYPVRDDTGKIYWEKCRRAGRDNNGNEIVRIVDDKDYVLPGGTIIPATWLHQPDLLKELVTRMTCVNPVERISLLEALNHNFWEQYKLTEEEWITIQEQGAHTLKKISQHKRYPLF